MNSSATEFREAKAASVTVTEDTLSVELEDGRTVSVPISWYPRLLHGTSAERQKWEIIGSGDGIHWPDLDEDISIEGIIRGFPSNESQRSLQDWLSSRS